MFLYFCVLNCIRYVSVIDAGSTGSRMYIFGFNKFILKTVWMKKIQPGLSSIREEGIEEYLNVLLDSGKEYLMDRGYYVDSEGAHNHFVEKQEDTKGISDSNELEDKCICSVRLSLNATAGLRLLSYSLQRDIMDKVKGVLESSGFSVVPRENGIISGGMEGVYMWETLFLLKLYTMKANILNFIDRESFKMGIFEMGGASSQLAYRMNTAPHSEIILFSESYLGTGKQEAIKSVRKDSKYKMCKEHNKYCDILFRKILENNIQEQNVYHLERIYLTGYFYYQLRKLFYPARYFKVNHSVNTGDTQPLKNIADQLKNTKDSNTYSNTSHTEEISGYSTETDHRENYSDSNHSSDSNYHDLSNNSNNPSDGNNTTTKPNNTKCTDKVCDPSSNDIPKDIPGINTDIEEIKSLYKIYCTSIRTRNCEGLFYVITFLEYFNIDKRQELVVLNKVKGLPLEWTLGRAIEMI